ncbi:hypothetical protein AAG906_037026 [Vitis piasezkii]
MEAVEGVALYSSSGVLFGMLTSFDVDKFARQHHFQTEHEKLRKLQVCIVGVLNDAEKNQVSKPSVKTWLDEANHLMYGAEGKVSALKGSSVTPPTPLVDATIACGRKEDKENIVELLLSNQESESKVDVISIVGMAGIGKTTLAQLAILCSVTSTNDDLPDLEQVQVKLRDAVAGKMFLLVLDDVWHQDPWKWVLQSPFAAGAKGIKIILTTRSQNVAKMMGSVYLHQAVLFEECFAKNMSGRPLATNGLGLLLQSEPSDQWETVLNSEMWTAADEYILPHLRLTYSYLPFQLKRCFAYCAIFLRDCEFEVNELVLLWMAEGLIQQPAENPEMEDLGAEYFQVLKKFETFKEVNYLRTFLAILPTAAPEDNEAVYNSTTRVLDELLAKFKCLRILSIRGYQLSELPHSIGTSMYLRYLNLSLTAIKGLPDSVVTLLHLQTLLLHGCKSLTELPQSIGNLTNLRHLDIRGTNQLQEMPPQIGNLKALRTLLKFIVSKGSGSSLYRK